MATAPSSVWTFPIETASASTPVAETNAAAASGSVSEACELSTRPQLSPSGSEPSSALDRQSSRVGGVHELRVRLGVARAEHDGVEARLDGAEAVLERMRLVQEQRNGDGASLRRQAPGQCEDLDPAAIEPVLVDEEAAEPDDRRRMLELRGAEHCVEGVSVPRLEVADGVAAVPCVGEQVGERDERH